MAGGLQVSSIDIITLTRIGNRSCACDNFILKWGVNPFKLSVFHFL